MITDRALEVSTVQVVTATAVSTNSVDLAAEPNSIGTSKLLAMFTVNTTADSAGDGAVVAFEVITASDAALTSDVTRVGTSLAIAEAALAANRPAIIVEINRDTENFDATAQRYLGARFTVTVEDLTAGAFTCNFLLDPADMRHFPGT